jgi:hypothetical protein
LGDDPVARRIVPEGSSIAGLLERGLRIGATVGGILKHCSGGGVGLFGCSPEVIAALFRTAASSERENYSSDRQDAHL